MLRHLMLFVGLNNKFKTMRKILLVISLLILFVFTESEYSFSQVELVPVEDPVYDYFKRMQLLDIINYNSSDKPISRRKAAEFISTIKDNERKLTKIDREILSDLETEFSYDLTGSLDKSQGFLNDGKFNIFNDKKQKYLYMFADSNASFFFDGIGSLQQGLSTGDSAGKRVVTLGRVGFKMRGTVLNSVGYYLRADNGMVLGGNRHDRRIAYVDDQKLIVNGKFLGDGFFESYEGYIRYAMKNDIFSAMIGKENVQNGFGYNDNLFQSDNTVSYNYIRFDLNYKALHYSFMYSSLRGDSLGIREIAMKNLVSHRLTLSLSNRLRFGIYEALVTVDRPFNITYLVPLSLLRGADYNAGNEQSGLNNALMGFDVEYMPVNKFAMQGTLLIDDLNFSTLFDNKQDDGRPANDNRFGIQIGSIWTNAFTVPDLTAALEYTLIDPFVYTHRTNKAQYTNWTLPLGHNLGPNSDEIALKLNYNFSSRLRAELLFQHQRSAKGVVIQNDSLIINYGGDINRGDTDIRQPHKFLEGNRINRDILTINLNWQPIRQYFLNLKFVHRNINKIFNSSSLKDSFGFLTFSIIY